MKQYSDRTPLTCPGITIQGRTAQSIAVRPQFLRIVAPASARYREADSQLHLVDGTAAEPIAVVSGHLQERPLSIQDWGAIGEIVGAIAVVASLIYLAVQIRQNTRQISLNLESSKLAAFEQNVESGNRAREVLITNPAVAELFLKGLVDYRNLPATDRFRCNMLFRNLLSAIQGGYIRQLTLGGDPEQFSGTAKMLDSLLENPGIHQWLEDVEPDWRPEFAELVASRIKEFE